MQQTNSISSKHLVSCGNCKGGPRVNVPPFMRCSLCKQILYCSKVCETVDWPRYKATCKAERDKQTKSVSSL